MLRIGTIFGMITMLVTTTSSVVRPNYFLSPNLGPPLTYLLSSPPLDFVIHIPIPTRVHYKQFRNCIVLAVDKCSAIDEPSNGKTELIV